ncbi:nitrite reductase large subunit NirB [Bermanella sp. WJH001]|uniref:nitrite reductase large subunit NirB n=1 Tax=Bermanella sp. WJH001 TaxID=3048005 RepID=UPI0024BEC0C4|nr:nitrite reductase large subunit NirB [Bermanella sp. WJH001]MDJ1539565.1 nitrite reductase large subunit NirB [Bermanella sp. WJH001]
MTNKQNLIVIGNGMVGHKFLESLVELEQAQNYNITVLCEEPRPAYDRVYLSSYFSGKTAEDLSLVSDGFFEANNIELKLNCKAASLDRAAKTVTTQTGETLSYDKVILATGSYPFVPPVPGHERDNCLVYRTIEDLESIKASAAKGKVGVVVGGGLLGLEAAKALHDLGLETHVVEFAPRLMAVQVDDAGGALLKTKIEELGVKVHTSKNTQNITDGDECFHKMEYADGESLETDVILFSAGIRPSDAIARESELELGPRGGISINNHCQTSDENIYAIGECALWGGMIYGLVAPGYNMAKVAAQHLTQSGDAVFEGADMSTKLKLMGVDVASIGDCHARSEGALSYAYTDEVNQVYKKIVVSADKKLLLGAVMIGDAEDYGNLLQMALNNIELPASPEALILPSLDGAAKPMLGPDALPDTAQICSCFDVSKGAICCSVQDGAQTIGDVKADTKAGTGCGGCTALVTQVMNSELAKLGVEVNTDICEHFAYTRQDIYNIVRIEGIKSFGELLSKHGKGHGCEICKPLVGSVLASCWNEYVLDDKHIGLQDTNDIYLGNMQKDGTYSVVPRMAGGEVTPEGLITIGQIAKDYGLYTKLTGGQRVDMFGAQLHQLPEIWRRLVDAGFETGHAYGKSLRTVKSCVGSTWCRYGVDDSVGLAIELENRYKGLRSPHKIKFAVSGCTRECAEAQSKDVGVIATENGWNLYVCGNGGMKPRHTDLLAQGLDKETLIKYIDRFLMFYVKTADRLQRTSVWMDNLEGGLDYLKQVVLDDSLGMADELESQMAAVVGTYQCEWKTTIESPEKLKRFSHFINADKKDDNIQFVKERGQIRPANETERMKKENLIAIS